MIDRKNILVSVCILVYSLIILLPPIVHGYIYPNMGDDFATHTGYLKYDNLFNLNYLGYAYVGYPLKLIESISGIEMVVLFFWFNYAVLILVGLVSYFVLTSLIDYKAGLLSLAIPFMCSMGLISQFDFGMIFDMINVGIILPLTIYFGIRWFQYRKIYQLFLL